MNAALSIPRPGWPTVNTEQREAVTSVMGMGLANLWEMSPIRLADNYAHCEEIIDVLFLNNPLLCCGKRNSKFATRPREDWRGHLAEQQLIVPSSMLGRIGLTRWQRVGTLFSKYRAATVLGYRTGWRDN
jgi:hypothetical protein